MVRYWEHVWWWWSIRNMCGGGLLGECVVVGVLGAGVVVRH